MTTSLLNKTNHTKPKPTIPSNPLKHNNFLTSLEKSKPSLSNEHTNNSNNNPLPLSSPINALLPPVIQTKENTTCEILIADFEFRPKQARVKINSKVQWTIGENKTSHQSGIYSTENRNFVIGIPDFDEESDLLSRGQTFEFYFNKTGNFDVICSNYPRMQGKVEVYGDEDEIMYKKVQHEMKARGLLLSGKQFDEKFFGHGHNNHKPILASPPPKKIQDKYPSPYKNLEEAHSEEDSNVQELLQELNAKGPSIKSNKSKGKGSKRKEFEFDDERKTEELFKQLRSRSEASDEDDDIRNFSLDTSDAYRMSDNEEEEDKDEELETKYNAILMSPSKFTIHEIMKMGAKLENSMIKKEKLEEEEEKKKNAQQKESEAPINQGDILIEIRQELENNDHEEEKLKDVVMPSSEKDLEVGEQEKENLNEKPKKKNKNKKKKKKKAAGGAKNADPSAENTPTASQETVAAEMKDKKEKNTANEIKVVETNKVEPKTENKQQEKPKDSIVAKEKIENKNSIEKENKNIVPAVKTPEPIISKPLIEEQKFQTVIPSSTVKETKNQNTKEVVTEKKKIDNNKKGSTNNEKTSKINEPPKIPQQQISSAKVNEQKSSGEAKSQNNTLPTPKINETPKNQNQIEDQKNLVNNDNKDKKKKKKNNKKRKELNRQNSVPSEPKSEVELEKVETLENPQDLIITSPIPVLKEAIPLTAETSEATSSEEKEPALLGNEAFLAFLKDAVKPEASKYQKSFRSNKNKNKKAQKEIDYSEEDDRIAALSAFLSNRYDYAEAFNCVQHLKRENLEVEEKLLDNLL